MNDLIKLNKRTISERLIIAKSLIDGIIDELPSTRPYQDRCKTCIHDKEPWWSDACDPCCGDNYEAAQPEWNNHTVACILAELFDDPCACNYNGIDEWLPEKCEVIDACPNPVGVACWEQYLKHRAERRTDE